MYSNCLKLQHVHEVFVKFKLSLTMALAGFLTFALIRGALASGYNGTINELSVCIDDSDCQDGLGSRCFMVKNHCLLDIFKAFNATWVVYPIIAKLVSANCKISSRSHDLGTKCRSAGVSFLPNTNCKY